MTAKLLLIAEVADHVRLSRQTVMRLIENGSLPGVCLHAGKRRKIWRVREVALEKWLNDREKSAKI